MKLTFEETRKSACAFSAGAFWLLYLLFLQLTLLLSDTSIHTQVVRFGAGIFFALALLMVTRYFWPRHRAKMLAVLALNSVGFIYYYLVITHLVDATADQSDDRTYYLLSQILMGIAIILLAWTLWSHELTPKFVSALLLIHGALWTLRASYAFVNHVPHLLITSSRLMTYVAEISFGLSWLWVGYRHLRGYRPTTNNYS